MEFIFVAAIVIGLIYLTLNAGKAEPHYPPVQLDEFLQRPSSQQSVPNSCAAPLQYEATQIRGPCYVVDGDTIVINRMNIRLAGIDAPEMDHPYGKNAKWHLLALTKGQVVIAYFEGSQSYTREVATCYLPDGRDLLAEMVKAGFAIDWPKFSGGKYRQYEQPDSRKRMWRADARQKGQWPPKPQV